MTVRKSATSLSRTVARAKARPAASEPSECHLRPLARRSTGMAWGDRKVGLNSRPFLFLPWILKRGRFMVNAKNTTGIFRPPGSERDGKARRTDDSARAITDAEVLRRDAKTARLRAARLAHEAQAMVETHKTPAARKK